MSGSFNYRYLNVGKKYTLAEAMEQERWYLLNDKTGDGLKFDWVDLRTEKPISFSF